MLTDMLLLWWVSLVVLVWVVLALVVDSAPGLKISLRLPALLVLLVWRRDEDRAGREWRVVSEDICGIEDDEGSFKLACCLTEKSRESLGRGLLGVEPRPVSCPVLVSLVVELESEEGRAPSAIPPLRPIGSAVSLIGESDSESLSFEMIGEL